MFYNIHKQSQNLTELIPLRLKQVKGDAKIILASLP